MGRANEALPGKDVAQARARDSTWLDFTLDAPAGCPTADEIAATLEASAPTPPAHPLKVSARIVNEAGRWGVSVDFNEGQRSVHGDSCEAVPRALVCHRRARRRATTA